MRMGTVIGVPVTADQINSLGRDPFMGIEDDVVGPQQRLADLYGSSDDQQSASTDHLHLAHTADQAQIERFRSCIGQEPFF